MDSMINLLDTLPSQEMNGIIQSSKMRFDMMINKALEDRTWTSSIEDACLVDQSIELSRKKEFKNWNNIFNSLLNLDESKTIILDMKGKSLSIETEGFTEIYIQSVDDRNSRVEINFDKPYNSFSQYWDQTKPNHTSKPTSKPDRVTFKGTEEGGFIAEDSNNPKQISPFYIEGCKTINSSYTICKTLYSGYLFMYNAILTTDLRVSQVLGIQNLSKINSAIYCK